MGISSSSAAEAMVSDFVTFAFMRWLDSRLRGNDRKNGNDGEGRNDRFYLINRFHV